MSSSISEQLCYSTVRIECKNDDGQTSTGTGFFFCFNISETETIPIIVTNKHVVNGMTVGQFLMTTSDLNDAPINTSHFTVTLPNLQTFIRQHPDKDVDLCALPLAPILKFAESKGTRLFYRTFEHHLIPSQQQYDELNALEDILMIGYPNGIWDKVNNMPILRRGSTATHPCLDYEGKKEFMIDAACFPGSSGSPVLIFNSSGYTTKNGSVIMGTPRILLMGVLYAVHQHIATGEIKVVNVSTLRQPLAFSSIPNNLGVVIKAERILELEQLFK